MIPSYEPASAKGGPPPGLHVTLLMWFTVQGANLVRLRIDVPSLNELTGDCPSHI